MAEMMIEEKSFVSRKRKRGAPSPRRRRRRVPVARPGEIKFHDLDVDDAVVATGGTIAEDSLLTIPEGIGEEQRIGRKITVVSVHMNWNILLPDTATANECTDTVRVIVYVDKQTNGAAPVVLDLLELADWQSFRNISNAQRFTFLLDQMVNVNCTAGSGRGATDTLSYGNNNRTLRWNKKLELPIIYDDSAATGAITTICCNNIGILTISRAGFAAFGSRIRVRYSDA